MYQNLFKNLSGAKDRWHNEEELRIGWIKELSISLGIELNAERDRLDSSYNNVIIEFKAPGAFHGQPSSPAFKEAINERLKPYILRKSKTEGIDPGDYIGIAIDGNHICFAQYVDNDISHGELLPFCLESVSMVSTALKDSYRRAITVQNLVDDFGLTADSGKNLMQALADALAANILQKRNNKIKMLFEEWQTLYGQVADLSSNQLDGIYRSIGFRLTHNVGGKLGIPAYLFVIHTYNSLIIKLLAAEVVSAHGLTSRSAFAQLVSTMPDDQIFTEMRDQIEKGRLFEAAGIKGFIEEVIFSWYLDACEDENLRRTVFSAIRETLIKLSFYRTDFLNEARTRDVLKGFYQALVPDNLRKSLGEFYTPDWLVEFTLEKLGNPDWLNYRFLDPTCGSGSFLLGILKKVRTEAEKKGLSAQETIRIITENIWGFDLNPLAVQTSRVNFLIAIADLLKFNPGQRIELPILMADAIYSPAPNPEDGSETVHYTIGSEIANLKIEIPSALAIDRLRLDKVFAIMGEQVGNDATFENTFQKLTKTGTISPTKSLQWESSLRVTYKRILELHRKKWNGIWFKIVRNFFWSATAGSFEIIIGNPPWVRWSKLPELYRERVKPVCEQYEIFSSTPHHGGNELDISGMITYTVADKWLKEGGQMTFVITQTHFQSASSEGFRSFAINNEDNLIPVAVDDMKEIKPFPDAANKTAIVLFRKEKNTKPKYPIQYNVWTTISGQSRNVPPNLSLPATLNRLKRVEMEANPVNGGRSPWAILPIGRFSILKQIAGESKWVKGRKGVTTDLNGVYFVKAVDANASTGLVQIETRPGAGKKNIGPKQRYWIEPDLLYPLLKGASDFSECFVSPKDELFIIVPNNGVNKKACEQATEKLDEEYPLTKDYLAGFEPFLRNRATWRRYLKGRPYWAIYNVGSYTFAPYKVVWAEQSKHFVAAVSTSKNVPLIGTRPYVPDHKVFFVPFLEKEPAYYLCGLLNSNLVREFIESHNISIQTGDIFKHMNLSPFDSSNLDHLKLAALIEKAHDPVYRDALAKARDLADVLVRK